MMEDVVFVRAAIDWALVALFAASTAISYYSAQAAKKKAKAASDKARAILINRVGVDEQIPVVYGTRRVGGIRVFTETQNIAKGLPNEMLYAVYVLCEGEIESISEIHVNGEPLTTGNKYEGLIEWKAYTGTDGQSADATLVDECASFTSSMTYSGLAYVTIKIRMPDWGDKNPFTGSIPEFTWLVKGKKVYDPRKDSTQTSISGSGSHRDDDSTTWEWSDNAALCAMDYMRSDRHGKDLPADSFEIESWADSADYLDSTETLVTTVVTNLGAPDSKTVLQDDYYYMVFSGDVTSSFNHIRGQVNAVTQNGNTFDVIGAYYYSSDQTFVAYHIGSSAPSPDIDLVNDVIISTDARPFRCDAVLDVSESLFDNLRTLLLGCRGLLPYSQGKYSLIIDRATSSSFSVTTDHIVGGIAFQGSSKDNRFNQVRVKFPDVALDYQPGEVVYPVVGSSDDTTFLAEDNGERLSDEVELETVTTESAAYNMAKILCLHSRYNKSIAFKGTSELLDVAVGDVLSITYPSYGWTGAEFRVESVAPSREGTVSISAREYNSGIYAYDATVAKANRLLTDLPDTYNVVAPTSLVLSDNSVQLGDGTLNPVLGVTWTASTDRFVRDYEIQWKKDSESVYRSIFTPNTNAALVVEAIDTYDVRVRALNGIGSTSDWITGSQLVNDDTTAPSAPTSVTATSAPFAIQLAWTNPSDSDLDAVEIHVRATNTTPSDDTYLEETVKAKAGKDQTFRLPAGDFDLDTTYYIFLKAVDYGGNESSFTSSVNAQFGKADTAQIQDGAIETAQIASNAVGKSQIANSAVDTNQIATDAVETVKILDNAVTLPTAAQSTSAYTITSSMNTWNTVQSVSVNPDGHDVLLTVNALLYHNGSGPQFAGIRLRRGATVLFDTTSFANDGYRIFEEEPMPFNMQYLDASAATSTQTWYLDVSRVGSTWTATFQAYNRNLTALVLLK